jgi:hypothetical protein
MFNLTVLTAALVIALAGAGIAQPQGDYTVWTCDALTKIFRKSKPPQPLPRTVRIRAAGNEYESAQVVIRAGSRSLEKVSLACTDLVGPRGGRIGARNIRLYRVAYVPVPGYETGCPDPLPPLTPFAVPPETNQPMWMTIYVPKGTPAGEYRATLTIREGGAPSRPIPVALTVWRFTLPDTPACRTAFAIGGGGVAYAHGADPKSRAYRQLIARYYLALLEHRISPLDPPLPLNSPGVGRFLNDPRVTSFVIPYSDDTQRMRADVERCRKNDWLSKAYFYPVDEPASAESYGRLKECADRIHSIDRSLKIVSPFYRGPDFPTDKTIYELLDGYLDIWCPNIQFFDEQAVRAKRAKGEEVWWYVTGQIPPYPTFTLNFADGVDHRILMWMQKLYDVQGLLYWCTTYWGPGPNTTKDPWEDLATVKDIDPHIYGVGSLFYPGSKVGLAGPVSSIRLECIRDGLEDFDYLTLLDGTPARQGVGAAKTKEIIRRLVRSLTDYEKNPRCLQLVRREIAQQLEQEGPAF